MCFCNYSFFLIIFNIKISLCLGIIFGLIGGLDKNIASAEIIKLNLKSFTKTKFMDFYMFLAITVSAFCMMGAFISNFTKEITLIFIAGFTAAFIVAFSTLINEKISLENIKYFNNTKFTLKKAIEGILFGLIAALGNSLIGLSLGLIVLFIMQLFGIHSLAIGSKFSKIIIYSLLFIGFIYGICIGFLFGFTGGFLSFRRTAKIYNPYRRLYALFLFDFIQISSIILLLGITFYSLKNRTLPLDILPAIYIYYVSIGFLIAILNSPLLKHFILLVILNGKKNI